MGEEIERDPNYFCSHKFPFLPIPAAATMRSPDHPYSSGMATPPLQTLASVPFKWEEEPGKPRPCTDIIALPAKRLELELPHPPCRMEPTPANIRMPSPNAVLDGPYSNIVGGRPKFYSFRLFKGSFDSSSSDQSPDESSDVLFGKKMMSSQKRRRYWFLKLKKKSTDGGGSFGSSHTTDDVHERCRKMRRSGSFSQASSSTHLWAAVYQSLKQVIPWKSTGKSKKDGSI
ncbi:hypothetical protein BUALT_Bualt19G0002000 [Buddleja alternifolia]|uniref:Uncharacterized protein n=1 Tax=Buddleja alternifolia TaxID=168488 RepID=A0AAV6W683_9LAMI|nr:hypothetical protein BUALT_Bualt19G0002000 [Buddleja alternifolia]